MLDMKNNIKKERRQKTNTKKQIELVSIKKQPINRMG